MNLLVYNVMNIESQHLCWALFQTEMFPQFKQYFVMNQFMFSLKRKNIFSNVKRNVYNINHLWVGYT